MRTTLNIDDDILTLARSLADSRKMSLGDAMSYLARLGANVKVPIRFVNGFAVFDVDESGPKFGPDDVAAALEADDQELLRYFAVPAK